MTACKVLEVDERTKMQMTIKPSEVDMNKAGVYLTDSQSMSY